MEFVEGQTVGIDLGTTFSAIAQLNAQGQPAPIPNEDDEDETPSVVLFVKGGPVVVGPPRARAIMEDPARVVERIKREMGNSDFKLQIDGNDLTPEFVSALILKKLCKDAERRIGKIGNAVITVPYYFNDARRKATQDAGRIAGLNVIDIINEPTAATLTYAWEQGQLGLGSNGEEKTRTAMVYDLGGGTFDVTLVRFTSTQFEVLATDGDTHLGGVDWTDRIVDHVADQFRDRHGIDPRESPQVMHVLRSDCDQAKIALSTDPQTSIVCRHGGKALSVPLSRLLFEELTADLMQRTLDTTDLVLEMASLEASQIDAIVLVGGSTLMPRVPQALKEITGIEPFRGLSPHTAVAQGAAIHAAILESRHLGDQSALAQAVRARLSRIQQQDVNSHGLGVVIRDPRSGRPMNYLMIRRNSKIPIEIKRTFDTAEANQRRVTIKVVEGDARDPAACSLLGICTVGLPPNLPKGSPIEVCYAYTAAGRVQVTAREKTSGKEAKIVIQRGGGLDDNQVDGYTRLANEYRVE